MGKPLHFKGSSFHRVINGAINARVGGPACTSTEL